MGDFRDALSRNNLKLPDLEFSRGDPLLRADVRLADVLDGIYRRGEFYLRWMQQISSLAFGTRAGRLFMRFAAIPFGGAVRDAGVPRTRSQGLDRLEGRGRAVGRNGPVVRRIPVRAD